MLVVMFGLTVLTTEIMSAMTIVPFLLCKEAKTEKDS